MILEARGAVDAPAGDDYRDFVLVSNVQPTQVREARQLPHTHTSPQDKHHSAAHLTGHTHTSRQDKHHCAALLRGQRPATPLALARIDAQPT